jgi:hypothetical protein
MRKTRKTFAGIMPTTTPPPALPTSSRKSKSNGRIAPIFLLLAVVVLLFSQQTSGPSTFETTINRATTETASFMTTTTAKNDPTTTTTTAGATTVTISTTSVNHSISYKNHGLDDSVKNTTTKTHFLASPAASRMDRTRMEHIDLVGRHSHRNNAASTFSGGVMGILSALTLQNRELRDFHRSTWIHDEDQLLVRHLFLLDEPTMESNAEQDIHGDLLYLNSTHRGVAVHYGEKLALWFQYAHHAFPHATWVGKMDDDVALCPHHAIWKHIHQYASPTMYLGAFHDDGEFATFHATTFHQPPQLAVNNKSSSTSTSTPRLERTLGMIHRMDEMFVILGGELVRRISARPLCSTTSSNTSSIHSSRRACDTIHGLYDTSFGGTSLGLWLTPYKDVQILPMGRKFYFWALRPNVPPRLCKHRMLLHKADLCRMKAVRCVSRVEGVGGFTRCACLNLQDIQ